MSAMTYRRHRGALAWLAGLACTATIAACGGSPAGESAQQAAQRFLASYAKPSGQVIRPDQGGDTVSEGQAYGMLLAELSGNNTAFQQIWSWTRSHLQEGNGLFAFHANPAGQVTDGQPASDADVLIAWALLRYQGSGQAAAHRDGRHVASAVLAHEVTTGPGGVPILAAGPWATGRPASLDPSYWSLPALQGLAQLTGNAQWSRMAAGAVRMTRTLSDGGRVLPPDWAELTASGSLQPEPAPDGSQPETEYGPDAQRIVAWFGTSCTPEAKSLAARWWPMLRNDKDQAATSLQPGGDVIDPAQGVLPMVASAAAAKAAGNSAVAGRLLQRAAQWQRKFPTYYGGAWQALGTALLDGSSFLSDC
ncbi:MAG: hypothetical protein J2P28_03450 [Actinobacteria bacterium]|nr:hypothetical protein [Actinomycetota bacterium]